MAIDNDSARLSNSDLLTEVTRAAADERGATVRLIALLAEFDARRLYLGEGCSSLFTYCTQVLHLSEHAAYGRIEAARAARKYPIILERLADGALTLTAVSLLRPHLTAENYHEVLDAARHKTKREIEELVARLRPQPAVPATIRKLPRTEPSSETATVPTDQSHTAATALPEARGVPGPPAPAAFPAKPAAVKPLSPERYKVQFTISAETHAKLRQVQDLLRHTVPNGDPAEIFDRALTVLLEQLQRSKLAAASRPRAQEPTARCSRHIPAAVRRAVWTRDGGRCAFVGAQGRCTETGFVEFHHVQPYAQGRAVTTANMELRCRAHNGYEAELLFGTRETPMVRENRIEYV